MPILSDMRVLFVTIPNILRPFLLELFLWKRHCFQLRLRLKPSNITRQWSFLSVYSRTPFLDNEQGALSSKHLH